MNSDRPVTVALVVAAPFPALRGSQVLVGQLAEGLARRGHRVHLVAYGAVSDAVPPTVTVHRLPRIWGCGVSASGPHPGKLVLDMLLTAKLWRVVRAHGVDLLHAHNYEAAVASLIVARLTGRPVVYHGHSAMADELPTYFSSRVGQVVGARLGRWLDRHVPCRADYCIGVSAELVALLRRRGVEADGVECVFPAGPDPEPCDDGPERQPLVSRGAVLLYAGNLDGYQNLDLLLRSFALVRAVRPQAILLVVTHAEGWRYRRRARRLRHAGIRVVRVRSFPEARRLIAGADVALCPRTEATGFPIKLLNYMAAGTPVVACAGSAKLIEHGRTGLVVPNGDTQAFAAAALRLLDDADERRRLGAAARATVETLCASRAMLDRIEDVYRRVLRRSAQAAHGSPVARRERWA
jgi:glycosyltransferase involved in cell wall biosynthesis